MNIFRRDPEEERRFSEIRQSYPIGRRLDYLGRTMVVTRHGLLYPGIGVIPGILCEYADENGVIHEHSFRYSALRAIG